MRLIKYVLKIISVFCFLLLSIAFIIGISRVFYRWNIADKGQFMFLLGFFSYIVIHIMFHKPIILHIFGHEVTHALVSWVFGGKLKSLNVSEKGGSVATNKTNLIVVLAPYFLPIYTLAIFVIYLIVDKKYVPYVIFFIGFSLAFHIMLTVYSSISNQPDFKVYGKVFSLSFIV